MPVLQKQDFLKMKQLLKHIKNTTGSRERDSNEVSSCKTEEKLLISHEKLSGIEKPKDTTHLEYSSGCIIPSVKG